MIIKHKLIGSALFINQKHCVTNTAKVQMLKNIAAASVNGCVQNHCRSVTIALRPAVHIASTCSISLLDIRFNYQQA